MSRLVFKPEDFANLEIMKDEVVPRNAAEMAQRIYDEYETGRLTNSKKNNRMYFVVEMIRNNDREQHSYIIGVYDDEILALKEAWEHIRFRAGKYGAEVSGFEMNTGKKSYCRELESWDAFAESCKDVAEKIKKMLDQDESQISDKDK